MIKKQNNNSLTEEQIKEMQNCYATEVCTHKQLAEEYGVSKSQIKKVLKGVAKYEKSILERFNEKWTEDENGCHIWTASKDRDGYGHFGMGDFIFRANRVSYMIHKGEIPKGLKVCHSCDNPSCVNPDHLNLGTHDDNMREKVERGRAKRPDLTEHDRLVINQLVNRGFIGKASIGKIYGTSGTTVRGIGKTDPLVLGIKQLIKMTLDDIEHCKEETFTNDLETLLDWLQQQLETEGAS